MARGCYAYSARYPGSRNGATTGFVRLTTRPRTVQREGQDFPFSSPRSAARAAVSRSCGRAEARPCAKPPLGHRVRSHGTSGSRTWGSRLEPNSRPTSDPSLGLPHVFCNFLRLNVLSNSHSPPLSARGGTWVRVRQHPGPKATGWRACPAGRPTWP